MNHYQELILMLDAEEVKQILEQFEKLKHKNKSKKTEDNVRKQQLQAKESSPGFPLFVQNEKCDLNNHENNDSKPFYAATFLKLEEDNAVCTLADEERRECGVAELKHPNFQVKAQHTLEYSQIAEKGAPDMVDIDELNNATLLYNLGNRYKKDEIYTYVGPILLALNPFKALPALGTKEVQESYMEIITAAAPLQVKKRLPPHIYAISALAYRNVKESKKRQAIVISGESGAGKTESAKIAMNFLTQITGGSGDQGDIGQKILDCNPILEGFGNSKTLRNNNSSRFGKYVLMYFSTYHDKVFGARIKNYLLEKSRVTKVAPNERGYHIFYFLIRGADANLLKKVHLLKPNGDRFKYTNFKYLQAGGDLSEEHDVEGFKDVETTMIDLKFSEKQQDAIWRSLSAVLHLGEIDFDEKSFDDPINPSKQGSIKNPEVVAVIAKLMGISDASYLEKILLQSYSLIGKEEFWKANSFKKSCDNRDALAKQIYNNMFNWLVKRMNTTIEPDGINDESFSEKAKTIGLLDIFGFENFKQNNFEQLCINYVNEKLHKLYIAAIFEAEKMELIEEGLAQKIEGIVYPDLKVMDIIKALDYRGGSARYNGVKFAVQPGVGLFTIVDDGCTSVLAGRTINWEDVSQNMGKEQKACKEFVQDFKNRQCFTIKHSAQDVTYDMREFVERNIDSIAQVLESAMVEKTDSAFSCIYQCILSPEDDREKQATAKTIWGKFNNQMEDLMIELAEPLLRMGEEQSKKVPTNVPDCELHFIRCIKPRPKPENANDRPGMFVHSMTLQQITYMGVLESVDLKQKNFPFRKKFEEFYAEYELLSHRFATLRYYQMNRMTENFEELAKDIMIKSMAGLGGEFYAVGRHKILMMPEARAILDRCKQRASEKRDASARVLKKAFCLHFGREKAMKQTRAIMCIQARYKLKFLKKKEKWAEQFKAQFEKAVIDFKAEKRKAWEYKAGKTIKDTLAKHKFRNHLNKALRARELVTRMSYNAVYISRLMKLMFSNTLAKRIVSKAFDRARERINGKAAWTVQRSFRGFLARSKDDRMDWIKQSIAAKENLRLHVSAKKVQKRLKGIIVRRRINLLHKTANKIQSHFRMMWFKQVFTVIKKNTAVLQRGARRYLARREIIQQRTKDFLTKELQFMHNVREMENFQLFGDEGNPDLVKSHTPYSLKKIFMFQRVADMHVITDLSEVHSTPWAAQWMRVYKDSIACEQPVMQLEIGATHSLAVTGRGRAYCWGWNDNGQCAKDPVYTDEVVIKQSSKNAQVDLNTQTFENTQSAGHGIKAKQIVSCEDRNLLICQDSNELYAWGGNEKGQLGLGHYQDVYLPTKVEFFSQQGLKVVSVSGCGNLSLACCENGESFAWPFQKGGQKFSIPVQMPFSEKMKINRVSCGFNFGFFISHQGLVYATGKDNQDGQLGLGHTYPNDIPELVSCFKDIGERIDSIECGFRHVVARSTLGKIYTWGWNAHGQLGQGHFDSELSPRPLTVERGKLAKEKVIQIAAGYSHTIVMTENRDLYWCGTSGSLQKQSSPTPFVLSTHMSSLFPTSNSIVYATGQQIDFAVVKINCTWSKSLSLTNLMIADLRAVNQTHPHNKIQSALHTLSTKWDQREVMPPYIDVVAGLFSANTMKKPSATSKPQGQGGYNSVNSRLGTTQFKSVRMSTARK